MYSLLHMILVSSVQGGFQGERHVCHTTFIPLPWSFLLTSEEALIFLLVFDVDRMARCYIVRLNMTWNWNHTRLRTTFWRQNLERALSSMFHRHGYWFSAAPPILWFLWSNLIYCVAPQKFKTLVNIKLFSLFLSNTFQSNSAVTLLKRSTTSHFRSYGLRRFKNIIFNTIFFIICNFFGTRHRRKIRVPMHCFLVKTS